MNKVDLRRFKRMLAGMLTIAALILMQPDMGYAVKGEADCKGLILRKSASKSSRALQTLQQGDQFEILSQSGDWYKVRYGKYTGFVMKKFVQAHGTVEEAGETKENKEKASTASDAAMKGIDHIRDIGDTPATSRKGDTGTDVKKLQQALKLKGYYSGTVDSKYGAMTEKAVKAFQKSRGLSQDGIAGKVTIKLLFGDNASDHQTKSYQTQKLNWFDGGNEAIPKGATFTVKDVKTGKTFTCRRWSGANHMDVEPRTAKDASIMKEIYGGSWSWDRRAILIKYDENVYAASMNGMPHGSQTISGNDFDGHFCIHFYKSKTHETKRVDAAHQNAVNRAARSTW